MKEFINKYLYPADQSNFKGDLSVDDILESLKIRKDEYYEALLLAPGTDYEVHLKRLPDSCFVNNYNETVLLAWQANIDIQPVFNHHKCVTYLCSYLSKGETHCSEAMRVAAKEAKKDNLDLKQSLRKIGAAFLSCREVSMQECVYRCLPELWLWKTFPRTIFVNTDLPELRIRTRKNSQQLPDLDDESTDIYNSNIIERRCQIHEWKICCSRQPLLSRICCLLF